MRARQHATQTAPIAAASARSGELARELRGELEGVIAREASRPYFHYQNLFHDPHASAKSVAPSPLATGPGDPLVLGYFQIDAGARVTTPSINDDFPELSEREHLAENRAFRDDVIRELARTLAPEPQEPAPKPPVAHAEVRPRPQTYQVDPSTYAQNASSNAVYWQQAANTAPRPPSIPRAEPPAPVTITVSPLDWHTLSFAGAPALIAVRHVQTPDGTLVQGFVIDRATVTSWLAAHAGEMVAELHTGTTGGAELVSGWQLQIAPNPRALAGATAEASQIARAFVLRFAVVGGIGVLAALLVLLLVVHAERLARERSQFAAAAAHELRTPLAGLQLYGDMLAGGLGDPAKQADYARRMSEEAARLGRVVSNVLGFSQLERGNLSVDAQVGSLDEALRELAERAEPALDRAGAALELDVTPELRARFDRDVLARIVGNLLDNAEKYARGAADRTIRLAAVDRGDVVEVVVTDRGPGVADKTRLFHAFSRGVTADGPAGARPRKLDALAFTRAHDGRRPRLSPGRRRRRLVRVAPAACVTVALRSATLDRRSAVPATSNRASPASRSRYARCSVSAQMRLACAVLFAACGHQPSLTGDAGGDAATTWQPALGAHWDPTNSYVSFEIASTRATRIELELFDQPTGAAAIASVAMAQRENVWSAQVPAAQLPATIYYGYRAWGPNWPYDPAWQPGADTGWITDVDSAGNRMNPNKLVFDPYAYELSHDPQTPAQADGAPYATGSDRELDSAPVAPKGIVLADDAPDFGAKPAHGLVDDVIYEVHVRGFTEADAMTFRPCAGTYAGAATRAQYLADLGVTAVEFLPIAETQNDRNDVDPASDSGDNYWGYSTLAYFAPDRRYACDRTPGGPTREVRAMVRAFHDLGIKVLLDVVYNHTAEGSGSSLLSLRGLDNAGYYQLDSAGTGFTNSNGVGADVARRSSHGTRGRSHPRFAALLARPAIGVHGFRVDLAPVLGNSCGPGCFTFDPSSLPLTIAQQLGRGADGTGADLVAEPWAEVAGSYQVGNFPPGWSEWNDHVRDTIREDQNEVGVTAVTPSALAARIAGSSDLYEHDSRTPAAGVTYVVSHDGFTLHDLYACNASNNTQAWPYGPSNGGSIDELRVGSLAAIRSRSGRRRAPGSRSSCCRRGCR